MGIGELIPLTTQTEKHMTLQGKTAVVTGGRRGIGRAYCEQLAADGANVVVVDIDDASDVIFELPGNGEKVAMVCDVSKDEEISALCATVIERFGRCDIFVNNAATLPTSTLETVTLDLWRRVQATNVEPLLIFAQAFVPRMAEAGWGRIVATGSGVTLAPQIKDIAYLTSKGSVHALVRALANELADRGITVNAIAPTVIATPGLIGRMPDGGPTADDLVEAVASQTPISRRSVPEDLKAALGFLVSEQAGFVTGQIIHVDGGLTRSGA
jgi:NAD(P)-dependent dehydrogenase (short-subunit alcohol dehydrogenase family)